MDYFFKSEGCPGCEYAYKALLGKEDLWKDDLTIVEVQYDPETSKYITIVDNKETGESPVGVVPAYFSEEKDTLFIGYTDVRRELENAIWNHRS